MRINLNKKINAGSLEELSQKIKRLDQNFENVNNYISQMEAINNDKNPRMYKTVNDSSEYVNNRHIIKYVDDGTLFGTSLIRLDDGINRASHTLQMIKDRLSNYENGISAIENDASKRIEDINIKDIFDDDNTEVLYVPIHHHIPTGLNYTQLTGIDGTTGQTVYSNASLHNFDTIEREQYLKKLNDNPTEKVEFIENVSPDVNKKKLYNLNGTYEDEKDLVAVKNNYKDISQKKLYNLNGKYEDEKDLVAVKNANKAEDYMKNVNTIDDEKLLMDVDEELAKEFKELVKLNLEETNSELRNL